MKKEESGKEWRGMSEDIIVGMTEWRQRNPKATFRAIEAELDRRLDE
jgi:phage host-nuclease inhibitor protein Gam